MQSCLLLVTLVTLLYAIQSSRMLGADMRNLGFGGVLSKILLVNQPADVLTTGD